jgi:hypothetical protein
VLSITSANTNNPLHVRLVDGSTHHTTVAAANQALALVHLPLRLWLSATMAAWSHLMAVRERAHWCGMQ